MVSFRLLFYDLKLGLLTLLLIVATKSFSWRIFSWVFCNFLLKARLQLNLIFKWKSIITVSFHLLLYVS